jgi:hypothetical protein
MMQRWSPDTCGCSVFEEHYDTDPDPDPNMSYLPHAAAQELADQILDAQGKPRREQPPEVLCPVHRALGNTPARFAALQDESARKNLTRSLAIAVAPRITDADYVWTFDQKRVLMASFPFLSPRLKEVERAEIQDSCDLQFGPLRIKVL